MPLRCRVIAAGAVHLSTSKLFDDPARAHIAACSSRRAPHSLVQRAAHSSSTQLQLRAPSTREHRKQVQLNLLFTAPSRAAEAVEAVNIMLTTNASYENETSPRTPRYRPRS